MKKAGERKEFDSEPAVDPMALVQQVLRESYLEATEALRDYAEKVRQFNNQKKAVREYLANLRRFRTCVMSAAHARGVDLCRANKNDLAILARLFKEHARPYNVSQDEYELCIPNRIPPAGADSVALLDNEIARWGDRLATMSDDAQLATIDLQNSLQRAQQILSTLSNISRMTHEGTMAVIRNLKV